MRDRPMRCVRDGRETHGTFAVQRQGRFHSLLRGRAPRDGHAERLKPAVALPQAATGLGEPELGQASRARAGAAAAALCPRSAYLPLATARRGGGPRPAGDASLSRCDRREDCETGRAPPRCGSHALACVVGVGKILSILQQTHAQQRDRVCNDCEDCTGCRVICGSHYGGYDSCAWHSNDARTRVVQLFSAAAGSRS